MASQQHQLGLLFSSLKPPRRVVHEPFGNEVLTEGNFVLVHRVPVELPIDTIPSVGSMHIEVVARVDALAPGIVDVAFQGQAVAALQKITQLVVQAAPCGSHRDRQHYLPTEDKNAVQDFRER